jgi:hypothetical protein
VGMRGNNAQQPQPSCFDWSEIAKQTRNQQTMGFRPDQPDLHTVRLRRHMSPHECGTSYGDQSGSFTRPQKHMYRLGTTKEMLWHPGHRQPSIGRPELFTSDSAIASRPAAILSLRVSL